MSASPERFRPLLPPSAEMADRPSVVRFRLPEGGRLQRIFDLPLDEIPSAIDALVAIDPPVRLIVETDPAFGEGFLTEVVTYAKRRGLKPAVSFTGPAADEDFRLLYDLGVTEVELVTDRPDEAFLRALLVLAEGRFATDVRFLLTGRNLTRVGEAFEAAERLAARAFRVVFPFDRERTYLLTASDFEDLFNFLYGALVDSALYIDTEHAPHFRRFVLERLMAERQAKRRPTVRAAYIPGLALDLADTTMIFRAPEWFKGDPALKTHGLGPGDGLLHIDATGRILPAERFPTDAGNVKTHDLADVYRNSPLFKGLRARKGVKGKCRVCPYLYICGGCRERAWAFGGDYLLEDPLCAFSFSKKLKRL